MIQLNIIKDLAHVHRAGAVLPSWDAGAHTSLPRTAWEALPCLLHQVKQTFNYFLWHWLNVTPKMVAILWVQLKLIFLCLNKFIYLFRFSLQDLILFRVNVEVVRQSRQLTTRLNFPLLLIPLCFGWVLSIHLMLQNLYNPPTICRCRSSQLCNSEIQRRRRRR